MSISTVETVVGQKIGLKAYITDNSGAVDLTGGTVVFEYYKVGNATSTPDGEIDGTIEEIATGYVTGEIPAAINDTAGKYMKAQAKATVSGDTYRANEATCFEILPPGSC